MMHAFQEQRPYHNLRELVVEATLSLARLDAERLEELALSCRALNSDLAGLSEAQSAELNCEARAASGEMAVFGRVLDATRANLDVMDGLSDPGRGRREYSPKRAGISAGPWALTEKIHGYD